MNAANKRKLNKKRVKGKQDNADRRTFTAVKDTLSNIGKGFSEGTDKVADIVLDSSQKLEGAKIQRLKEATAGMVKNIFGGIKNNLKDIKSEDVLCDAAYQIGRYSKIVKDNCAQIFNDLME